MRKYTSILIALLLVILFASCGSMRVADVSNLSVGMSQSEVNQIMGQPIRILSSTYDQNGRLEAFEYRTYRNEAYAIEFWNGRMERYDFMYEDYNYPPATIVTRPGYYTPSPGRPSQPSRPSNNNRPSTSNSGRPNTNTSTGNSGRPTTSERPTYGTDQTTKPTENNTGRPSTSGSTSSGRESSNSSSGSRESGRQSETNRDKR